MGADFRNTQKNLKIKGLPLLKLGVQNEHSSKSVGIYTIQHLSKSVGAAAPTAPLLTRSLNLDIRYAFQTLPLCVKDKSVYVSHTSVFHHDKNFRYPIHVVPLLGLPCKVGRHPYKVGSSKLLEKIN